MGVICLKGKGEAEATCAQLNAQGVSVLFILMLKNVMLCLKTIFAVLEWIGP